MAHTMPEPGLYRRKRDNAEVIVVGCTGDTSFVDTVHCRTENRSWHVRLENFWEKYELSGRGDR